MAEGLYHGHLPKVHWRRLTQFRRHIAGLRAPVPLMNTRGNSSNQVVTALDAVAHASGFHGDAPPEQSCLQEAVQSKVTPEMMGHEVNTALDMNALVSTFHRSPVIFIDLMVHQTVSTAIQKLCERTTVSAPLCEAIHEHFGMWHPTNYCIGLLH